MSDSLTKDVEILSQCDSCAGLGYCFQTVHTLLGPLRGNYCYQMKPQVIWYLFFQNIHVKNT